MKNRGPWLLAFFLASPFGAGAQQSGTQPTTSLLACGAHGDLTVICGTQQPEDLELTPDGKFLIATRYVNQGRGGSTVGSSDGGLALFNLATQRFRRMPETSQPDKSWGDPACPGPIGNALVSHGSSLSKRRNGVWALYTVNHGGRQSIEMYELKRAAGAWSVVWRGCEIAVHEFNDVAILPDGGFVGTYPSGLSAQGGAPAQGAPTGYVARWTPGKGESEVPGSRIRLPNGVVVSSDGRYMYVNEFGARKVRKFDLQTSAEGASADVEFLPDNLTWTKAGKLLVAGVKGARGDCPEASGRHCIDGFGIAEIDPATMRARTIFDSPTVDPVMSGVSVALQAGNSIYIGAFLGDRLLRIPYKK